MALDFKPGSSIRVTIKKSINREGAKKTIERLFMKDKAIRQPIDVRSANFKEQPKRRGGQIWTKRPNKLHPSLERGTAATIMATPQALKDLNSVADFVEVASA
ncbi:MAG TPA: hypothetical protein VF669_11925 [Tepidisphaeraceae bacterium]|jgi:hypothetical protein